MTSDFTLEKFSGRGGQKIGRWFRQYDFILADKRITADADKCQRIMMYLEGPPADWYFSRQDAGTLPASYDELKAEMISKFDEPEKICQMMGGDLDRYIADFETIARVAKLGEEEKIRLFKNGLEYQLFVAVGAVPVESFEALKEFLLQTQRKKASNVGESFSVFKADARTSYEEPRSYVERSPEELELLKERRCFRCKQKGHISRFCRATLPPAAASATPPSTPSVVSELAQSKGQAKH